MSHRSKIIKERIDVNVSSPNQTFKGSLEVDKHAALILGITLIANFEDRMYHRGTQRITINEKEIYPQGHESKLLMQGLNVPVNTRIIDLGEAVPPGNRKVEIEYTDTDHPYAPFTPYRVTLHVYSRLDD